MELSVKTLDSHTHNFKDLDEEITVLAFKSHISSTVTLPPEQQRLIFRGRVLQDDKKLKDYNVTSGQVVHLVARNPTSTSTSNDHPQPQSDTDDGGGVGVGRNAIIMGTIGTLEFQNAGGPGGGPSRRRRNAAAVRIAVANQCITRASDLLHGLEEDVTHLHAQTGNSEEGEGDGEDIGIMDAIGRHHAATAAAVVASIQQRTQIQVESGGVPEASREASGAATPISTENENGNSWTAAAGNSARPEAPMLRELATSINDVLALNARLTPYLQTVQRWLAENGDLEDNQASVQYTYNAVSSILHSVSHSLHALSDITVDFSLPPGQRRLRAPTSVWVEQSPVIRATIPIGVHVGVETTVVPNAHAHNAPTTGTGAPGPQFMAHGNLPAGAGGMQLQQAISNLIQGVMSGQVQPQQMPQQMPPPPPPPLPPQWTADSANVNATPRPTPPGGIHPIMMNQLGALFGQQGIQLQTGPVPAPSASNGQAGQNAAAASAGMRTTTIGASQQPPPQGAHPQVMNPNSFLGPRPRMEQIVLQCQSHHYAANATLPPRPENLRAFLTDASSIPVGEETAIFDAFVSMLQGLNIIHPIISQYIRGSILRGRDINNPGHVTTGVRVYARKLVDWIVGSISASTGREFDSAGLTARLLEVVTKFMSKVAEVILTAPAGSAITPALGSLLNEWMPNLLTALESTFPTPGHLRILKGIILLIATTCFPASPVVFRTHLTAGIAEYLINCQPTPPEPEPEPDMEHFEADLAMEIDVEFERVDRAENQMGTTGRSWSTGPEAPPTQVRTSTPIPRPSDDLVGRRPSSADEGDDDDDDEEDLESQFRSMTNTLFRDLPQEWHPTLLNDLQRQEQLRVESPDQRPPFSVGFLSLFPQK